MARKCDRQGITPAFVPIGNSDSENRVLASVERSPDLLAPIPSVLRASPIGQLNASLGCLNETLAILCKISENSGFGKTGQGQGLTAGAETMPTQYQVISPDGTLVGEGTSIDEVVEVVRACAARSVSRRYRQIRSRSGTKLFAQSGERSSKRRADGSN